ncbi:LacI family DNA-binding transcriptional regulator [Nocardioides sp. YIM 152315]|uniref:LacI family DNA-binding transcriptional regulator n=1 Tax=Nocardioides sp. YIM 152315 TaxID=3031760 RepID=UPI0023DCBC9F|nr:LacI family DNA-binding transcriptional regulator [Nocardioides sp. YIM 152315]MDF1605413.1 LacI family DNA-binding transcriptional regulator [Nocardioides sp. YIM 152315]
MPRREPTRNGDSPGRVTIAHVADRAGVSPTTVSHVLSGKRVVNATTRDVVLDAIRELGYRPNHVARNLRTRQSHMIAVVVPDITNPFYAVLTRGLADAVDAAGYGSYVCSTDGQRDRERKFFQDVMDRGVDGIVFASGETASEVTFGPADYTTPIICIGGHLDHPLCDAVTPDDEAGSRAAASFLAARGYERIAMIQGPQRYGSQRTAGFRAAMQAAKHKVPTELMARGDWTRKGGYDAMRGLMTLDRRPDAVFCANDLMAIGALDVAHELGLDVPTDVAIMGFDDVDAATIVTPQLTTVRNPAYEAGSTAGDLLMSRMSGRYTGAGRTVVLPCPLVVRGTV